MFIPLMLCAALLYSIPIPVGASSKPLVVVVSKSLALKDISMGELRRAFQGEAITLGGTRMTAINLPLASSPREQFDLAVLGLKPHEVGRFWVDRRIRDQSPPPKAVDSPELALRVASTVPGVITYTTMDAVTDKLRVLTIGGRSPGQTGYPLN